MGPFLHKNIRVPVTNSAKIVKNPDAVIKLSQSQARSSLMNPRSLLILKARFFLSFEELPFALCSYLGIVVG